MTFNLCLNLICSMPSECKEPNLWREEPTVPSDDLPERGWSWSTDLVRGSNQAEDVHLSWRSFSTGQSGVQVRDGSRCRLFVYDVVQVPGKTDINLDLLHQTGQQASPERRSDLPRMVMASPSSLQDSSASMLS